MFLQKVASKFRKIYEGKFLFRCFALIATVCLWIFVPEQFEVMNGWNFFKEFTVFHFLWAIWMVDMLLQIFPSRKYLPLGSSKFSIKDFVPREIKNIKNLENVLSIANKCTTIEEFINKIQAMIDSDKEIINQIKLENK